MKFHVEQPDFRGVGLARDMGKVWHRMRVQRPFGKFTFLLGALALLFGAFALLGIAVTFKEFLNNPELLPTSVYGIVLTLFMILLGLSFTGICTLHNGWLMLFRLRKSKGDTRFFEDHLEDVDDGMSVTYQYSKFKTVFEGKRAFLLQVDNSRPLVLVIQKKYFTIGAPEEFRRFMDERCGKPVIPI